MKQRHSRRDFIRKTGSLTGASWLSLNMPVVLALGQVACSRRDAGESWKNLSAIEATGFAAVADQIIPPDETPGAAQAGVVYFFDEALGGFMAGASAMLKDGIADLDEKAVHRHPGAERFASLPFSDQTALLKQNEDSPFFQTMIMVTQIGMFALPEYGGNRDHAGWQLIGFEHRHAWQPPFGHYDAQYTDPEGDRVES